jgi:hypothetical protein
MIVGGLEFTEYCKEKITNVCGFLIAILVILLLGIGVLVFYLTIVPIIYIWGYIDDKRLS